MTIIALTEDDYGEHLERPHNPPDPTMSEEDFDVETSLKNLP